MQIACTQQEIHHHEQQKCLIKVLAVCDYGPLVLNSYLVESEIQSDWAEIIRSDWASTDDSVYIVNVTCVVNDNLP